MKLTPQIILTTMVATLAACGPKESTQRTDLLTEDEQRDRYTFNPDKPDYQLSEEHGYEFLKASTSKAGLVAKAHKDTIRACTNQTTNAKRVDLIERSILKWLRALDPVAKEPIAADVEVVSWNSSGCDVYISFGSYNPAHALMGTTPRINLATSGWYGSDTVTLHEFGHAFGLLDTYYGRGGGCKPGQPASVMCYAKYPDLKSDDILGVQSVYKDVFK